MNCCETDTVSIKQVLELLEAIFTITAFQVHDRYVTPVQLLDEGIDSSELEPEASEERILLKLSVSEAC